MTLRLFLILTVTATFARAQNRATLPAELTLRQALDIALANSSALQEARANLERSSGQYEQARSVLLPQLGVAARQAYLTQNVQGFGLDLSGQPTLLGPFGSMDARIVFNQDVLNIAGMRSWKSYSSRQDAARLMLNDAREVVTLN